LFDSYETFPGALIEEAGSIQIEAEQTIPAFDHFAAIGSKGSVSLVMSATPGGGERGA
jgi:hypothetical protein